jgi:hypothetical protein
MCRPPVILRLVVIRGTAAAVALVAALAGCSAEADPTPLPPLPSVSPTPVVPQLPPEATPETAQGASAFVRYFFQVVNSAYRDLDPSMVHALSDPECNSCASIVEDINRLREAGLTVAGDRYRLDFVATPGLQPGEPVIVDLRFDGDAYVEVGRDGARGSSYPPTIDQEGQARLTRSGIEWRLLGLRLVPAPT